MRSFWFEFRKYVAWLMLLFAVAANTSQVHDWFPTIDLRWFVFGGLVIFAVIMQARISSLEDKFKPKLDLVFGDYNSCKHLWQRGEVLHTLYRVGLINLGGENHK